jgi:putative transposase
VALVRQPALSGSRFLKPPALPGDMLLEIMPDHVHLLVEIDPQYGIHRLIKQIKGISSRVLRHEFPKIKSRLPTLWSNSYFVSTVGGAPLAIIKQYIENQKTS